jgi:hypothetical protein
LLPTASTHPISVSPGQAVPENAWIATSKAALGLTMIVAVPEFAKKLNHTSEAVVPVAQAGAGAPHGSIAVVGSYVFVLEKVVPVAGQLVNQDWLKLTALENNVPPPNCAWELMETISKKLKTTFWIIGSTDLYINKSITGFERI